MEMFFECIIPSRGNVLLLPLAVVWRNCKMINDFLETTTIEINYSQRESQHGFSCEQIYVKKLEHYGIHRTNLGNELLYRKTPMCPIR